MRVIVVAFGLLASSASAQSTWYVDANAATGGEGSIDAPFRTIQEGVDACAPTGDTVEIAAATYTDTIDIIEKALTLYAPERASLAYSALYHKEAIYVEDQPPGSTVRFEGLDCYEDLGGYYYGYAYLLDATNFANIEWIGCTIDDFVYAAKLQQAQPGSIVSYMRSNLSSWFTFDSGNGAFLGGDGSAYDIVFDDCDIRNVTGLVQSGGASVEIRNCRFSYCTDLLSASGPHTIVNSTFFATGYLGIGTLFGSLSISNCLFYGSVPGGAVLTFPPGSSYAVENCTFYYAHHWSGFGWPVYAIHPHRGSTGTVSNCVFLDSHDDLPDGYEATWSITNNADELGLGSIEGVDPRIAASASWNSGIPESSRGCLLPDSPAIDAGDPLKFDPDGSRRDMGYKPYTTSVQYCHYAENVGSHGALAILQDNGSPGLSGPDEYELTLTGMLPHHFAIWVLSSGAAQIPFGTPTLCVAPPFTRGSPMLADSTGTIVTSDLDGGYLSSIFAQPGDDLYIQFWLRDSGYAWNYNLSTALAMRVMP